MSPLYNSHNDFPWPLAVIFVFWLLYRSQRRSERRGNWKDRMQEMREKAAQRDEERRTFQSELLAAVRLQNELAAEQIALLKKLTGEPAAESPATDEEG